MSEIWLQPGDIVKRNNVPVVPVFSYSIIRYGGFPLYEGYTLVTSIFSESQLTTKGSDYE